MNRLRTIRLVAGFDLYESLRSKKAIALLALYTLAALAFCWGFIEVLNRAMAELADRLGQEATAQLLQSEELVDVLEDVVEDREVARELLSIPPLALFYGALVTNLMPIVIVLTSADCISAEVASGKIRYALFRADRLDWALGKLAGQVLLMCVGILIGGVAAYILGAVMLDTFEPGRTAWWLLVMCGRSVFYGFAYLGMAMCASMLVSGRFVAVVVGLGLFFAVVVAGVIAHIPALINQAPDVMNVVRQIFPRAHSTTLFHPSITKRLPSMLALTAIGAAFFYLGFLRFSRRDT
jgi:ABC-type transport system involved in multi-copper enzyme maturation permease subunit